MYINLIYDLKITCTHYSQSVLQRSTRKSCVKIVLNVYRVRLMSLVEICVYPVHFQLKILCNGKVTFYIRTLNYSG